MRFLFSIFTFSLCGFVYSQAPANWSSNNEYEQDDLVINSSITYIALQKVPIDIPITNTSYWSTLDSLVPGGDTTTVQDFAPASLDGLIMMVEEYENFEGQYFFGAFAGCG